MSQLMTQLLARLADMLPSQDYQSRLEQYIAQRNPASAAEIELWEREFQRSQNGGWL